jgi:hypothetical protein
VQQAASRKCILSFIGKIEPSKTINDVERQKKGMDSYLYKQLDKINKIIRIERPSTEGPLAAGEKNPINPVNPV